MSNMTPLASGKQTIAGSRIVRNTASMMVGGLVRTGLQGVYFVMIARSLGSSQYGAFVGVTALIAVLQPFAMLGTGNLMVQSVAQNRMKFRESWGNALFTTGILSGLWLVCILLGVHVFLPRDIPLSLVAIVGFADLFLVGIVILAGQAFQAFEELHQTSQLNVVLMSTRAVAALLLTVCFRHPDATTWSEFYLLSTGVTALYSFACVHKRLGSPALALGDLRRKVREGFYFAVSLASQSIYNNIDKTMLTRFSTLDAVGIYATAYRLIDLAFQPVSALLASTYAQFFRHGTDGLAGTTRFAKRLLPFSAGYGVLAGLGLVLIGPVVPMILGQSYSRTVEAMWWLSPIILMRSVHYLFADALTGAGLQGIRTSLQLLIAGQNVLLNLWLIPSHGWRGAAWASLASDGMLAICLIFTVLVLSRRKEEREVGCSEKTSEIGCSGETESMS